MTPIKDLVGKRFGRLIVQNLNSIRTKGGKTRWDCHCDCGGIKTIRSSDLLSNRTTSCGCFSKESHLVINSYPKGIGAQRNLFDAYQRRAKFLKLSFNISIEDFSLLTQQNCYYCGTKPNRIHHWGHSTGDYIYNGLDRVDNSRGYIIGNVVPCCTLCNMKKRDMNQLEFLTWIRKVYRYCNHPASVPLIH